MRSSRDQPPYDPNELVAERYRIIEPVVRGITGWIFRARDEKLGIQIALKTIFPNLVQTENEQERLIRTIKRATKVQHPNVARVYDDGRYKGHLFYTMPYLEGLTLRKIIDLRLERGNVFLPDEIMPLFGQLALAVDRLGSFGAHGALSPAAVIVLPDMLKVVSLPHLQGLPRRPFVALQMQDNALHYLAPEARREEVEIDPRADVYSLAVILGEMLTGQIYGGVGSNWGKAQRTLSAEMRQLFHRALAESADERIGTAGSFIDAVAELSEAGEAVLVSGEYPAMTESTISGIGAPPVTAPVPGAETEQKTALVPPPEGFPTELPEEDTERTEPSLVVMVDEPTEADPLEKSNVKVRTISAEDTQESRYVVELEEGLSTSEATHSPTKLYTLPKQSFVAAEKKAKPTATKSSGRGLSILLGVLVLAAVGAAGAYIWRYGWPPPMLMTWLESSPGKTVAQTSAKKAPEPQPTKEEPTPVPETDMVVKPLAAEASPEKSQDGSGNLLPRKAESAGENKDGAVPPAFPEPKPKPKKFAELTPPPPPSLPDAPKDTCPDDMVRVNEGRFVFGSQRNDPLRGFGEVDAKRVSLPTFCIDRYEYPNKAGTKVSAGASWQKALSTCAKAGKRLCTEREWERSCKGQAARDFPYGSNYRAGLCHLDQGSAASAPAGAYRDCRSSEGVYDLSGNVAEWTADSWAKGMPDKVLKGGAADQASFAGRCAARANADPKSKEAFIGFRCCLSVAN